MPNRNPEKHKRIRDYLQAVHSVVSVWMHKQSSAPLKDAYVGIILSEAFYTPNPWVSAQYIVSRMGVVSIDTVRRLLENMVDQGLVEFTEIDRKKVYRAIPQAAEATIRAIAP